jgi:LuxR family maltose regulon positive regulatory protein
MNLPLLRTKLFIPQSQANLVPRPGLLVHLEQGLDGKLTLVSAPAGFGKSTLLVEWVRKAEIPFGWVTLDVNDNDLGRFLSYFVAGLETINIQIDQQLLTLLRSPDEASIEAVLIPIINQISTAGNHFGFVFDDYHLLQSNPVHNAVTFLLDYLPPNMHLVISSRADPPLNLAKLRVNREMNEIRASNLRFSVDDAKELLNRIQGFELTNEDLEDLIIRTDGWIAGLQMVSVALEGKQFPTQYIRDFSGNQEYIADYLSIEVLNQQSDSVQDFLLKTSILDRICAPLCEAVTGQRESKQILKYLKDKNLFLMNLDDQGLWYRYHRLFADLNYQRLLETKSDRVSSYYQKASEWFEANGYIPEAIDYAFRGDDVERAASLIEIVAEDTLIRSEIATFIRWVETLPEEVICKKESLCIYYSWALMVSRGDYQKATTYLNQVAISSEGIKGRVNAIKAMLSVYQREINDAIQLAQEALDQLAEDDHFFRHIAAWNLSAYLFISGEKERGSKMLEEVVKVSLESNNLLVGLIALCRLGSYHFQEGNLDRAKALFEQAINVKPENQVQPIPAACEAMLGLGKVHWERYDLETASRHLLESLQLSKRWRSISDIDTYITLAHINQSQGNIDQANQYISAAKNLAIQNTTTDTDEKYVGSQEAIINLRQGNLPAVNRWAINRGLEEIIRINKIGEIGNRGVDIILLYELIVYARFLIADRQLERGLRLLDEILPSMERIGYLSKIFEIRILIALALQAQGKLEEAVSSLNSVMIRAETEGFRRIFIDEGDPMGQLIEASNSRGLKSKFAQQLSRNLRGVQADPHQAVDLVDMVEQLSDREVEVLRLLDSRRTVPEISDHLYIAVSTLRTHIRNIYSKLGVHSRFEAVSKGKNSKII